MASIPLTELRGLLDLTPAPRVSITLPTHRAGAEVQQDPVQLKNLLRQAEQQLMEPGLRRPQAEALLAPARALMLSNSFWQRQDVGLALYLAPEFFRYYHLPFPLPARVVIAEHFQLKPVLRALESGERFYILALSRNQVRLFRADRDQSQALDLPDTPGSLAEALQYDDLEEQHQFHTATQAPGSLGKRPAIHFGHGASADVEDSNLRRFLRQVAAGVQARLAEERAPLVLAGVPALLGLYREVSRYPGLMEQSLPGNPDAVPIQELRAQAWAMVQPAFEQPRQAAAERFRQLAGAGRVQASAELGTILPAAYSARVEILFLDAAAELWGRFEPDTLAVDVRAEQAPGDQDLLDLAAAHTLLNGGTVYACEAAQVPGGSGVAAIFRY